MSAVGDQIPGSEFLPPSMTKMPLRFWDRNKHMSWLKANLTARRIQNNPSSLAHLRRYLEALRYDPDNALTIRVWGDILGQGTEAVVKRITALDDEGELARDTMPPGIVLDEAEIIACIAERRRQEAQGLVVYGSGC